MQFCLNEVDCRRKLVLNHFTEAFDPASCKRMCDNCASPDGREDIDLSTPAVQFVKMMQQLQDKHLRITAAQSIHAFRGTSKQDMAKRKFDTIGQFGKGSSISVVQAKRLCDHLIGRRILILEVEDGDYAPIAYIYVFALHLSFVLLQWLTRESL
jgi:bloom syndrome protein